MKSAKNELQEFLQARGLKPPHYQTLEMSQFPAMFQTTIIFEVPGDYPPIPFTADQSFPSKKGAESYAADAALQHLNLMQNSRQNSEAKCQADNCQGASTKIVLVDADNFDVHKRHVELNSSIRFILFLSRNGTKNVDQLTALGNCEAHWAPTVGKDACDVYMCYETRRLRDDYPDHQFAILTRDHFGQCLAECAGAKYICNENELVSFLMI